MHMYTCTCSCSFIHPFILYLLIRPFIQHPFTIHSTTHLHIHPYIDYPFIIHHHPLIIPFYFHLSVHPSTHPSIHPSTLTNPLKVYTTCINSLYHKELYSLVALSLFPFFYFSSLLCFLLSCSRYFLTLLPHE